MSNISKCKVVKFKLQSARLKASSGKCKVVKCKVKVQNAKRKVQSARNRYSFVFHPMFIVWLSKFNTEYTGLTIPSTLIAHIEKSSCFYFLNNG
jgi:hypothetical protein